MNDETTTLDQAEEDILSCTASDDAIEAAAGIEGAVPSFVYFCPDMVRPD